MSAICSMYPPNGERAVDANVSASGLVAGGSCDPTPRHGFTSDCSDPKARGCAIGKRFSGAGDGVIAIAVLAFFSARARRLGSYEVTARAQGQFPIVADSAKKGALRVVKSGSLGMLIKPKPGAAKVPLVDPRVLQNSQAMAQDRIHDRPVDDVAKDIVSDWSRTHAK
jgi:hypothetical protein